MPAKPKSKHLKKDREPFLTIDDLTKKALELTEGLKKLSETKYPLDIRKGAILRREVVNMTDKSDESKMVKASTKTYFFDIKRTREGKPYLAITESRIKGNNGEQERSTVIVFPENAQEFAGTVSFMVKKLN